MREKYMTAISLRREVEWISALYQRAWDLGIAKKYARGVSIALRVVSSAAFDIERHLPREAKNDIYYAVGDPGALMDRQARADQMDLASLMAALDRATLRSVP